MRCIDMQNAHLDGLSFTQKIPHALAFRERHLGGMDQSFDAALKPCKSSVR